MSARVLDLSLDVVKSLDIALHLLRIELGADPTSYQPKDESEPVHVLERRHRRQLFGRRVGAAIRRGASGRASEQRPITEEEATYWADAMLRARFDGIEIAKLDVTALRLKPLGATVRLAGEDGCRYSVELELADGLVAVGEVWRTYPGEATDPPSA